RARPGRGLGSAAPLPDFDEVRILQGVGVGLEDLGVEIAVAIVLLGDLPERLPLLHLVPLRRVPGVLRVLRHHRLLWRRRRLASSALGTLSLPVTTTTAIRMMSRALDPLPPQECFGGTVPSRVTDRPARAPCAPPPGPRG